MNNYCVDLQVDLPLFDSNLSPVEFLKQKYTLTGHFQINTDDLNKKLSLWFLNLGLSIRLIEIFYRQPNAVGNIHSDTSIPGDYAKLNWVYGNGIMNWYKIAGINNSTIHITDINSHAIYYKESEVELVHSQKVGQPSLVQVGCPHKVINFDSERVCISLVFESINTKQRLTFQEAKTLFKDYIK
jgi:hypothetical protein